VIKLIDMYKFPPQLCIYIMFMFFGNKSKKDFSDFVSRPSINPQKTWVIHFEEVRGLKGFLHALNASIIHAKDS